MISILIADDNKDILNIIERYGKKEGYIVEGATDGEEAYELYKKKDFDLIILDIVMPKMDGLTLCTKIREESDVPIILLTARGEDYDRIMGLDKGADDYIVKPFSPGEVMARVRAILRRVENTTTSEEFISRGELKLFLNEHKAMTLDKEFSLTRREFEILWTLAKNKERVFSRENLLDLLWGYDYDGDLRTVDTHIKRLRAKLPPKEERNWEIVTVRGLGYKLEVKDE